LAFGLLSLLLLGSCSKDEEATGIGDAIIISKQSEAKTVYGLALYAYTFSSFKTVDATCSTAPATIYTLKSNQGYTTNFSYETPETEYTSTRPKSATVNFSAVFENGVTQAFQDELTENILAPLTIGSCTFNTTDNQLEVSWTPNSSASSYSVSLLDGSTVVFRGSELENSINSFKIGKTTSEWITQRATDGTESKYTPTVGKTYTLRVSAFLYESSANNAYNLQSISFADKSFKWGE